MDRNKTEGWSKIEQENIYFNQRRDKTRHFNTLVMITVVIEVIAWRVLIIICTEDKV